MKKLVIACSLIALAGCCPTKAKSGMGDGMAGGEGGIPSAQAGRELADVNFAFDSAELDATAREVLNRNAAWLKANPTRNFVIEGHCDERGTNEYNLALGERRARSVYSYLQAMGIADQRMGTVSYGEEIPLDPAHEETAWAKNRRAHAALK